MKQVAPTINCLLHYTKVFPVYLILLFFTLNAFATDCSLSVDARPDRHFCDPVTLTPLISGAAECPEVVKYYQLFDVNPTCENIIGMGVFFQRAEDCEGDHIPWNAGADLRLIEYSDGTAKIIGTITNDGQVGQVDIDLSDKILTGDSWDNECYTTKLVNEQYYYNHFYGTITIDGTVFTVEEKATGKDFILGEGAGNQGNGFGLGGWTDGTFGGCTEIFTNLLELTVPDELSNTTFAWSGPDGFTSTEQEITVDAAGTYTFTVTDCAGCVQTNEITLTAVDLNLDLGLDQEICDGQEIQITAEAIGASACREIANYYQIVDSDPVCEGVTGTGVVFQRGEDGEECQGDHIPWQAGEDLIFVEYDYGTAQIVGTITSNDQIGYVNILFTNKQTTGQTWENDCYLENLAEDRTFYQNFEGTITIDGVAYTVEQKTTGKDIILANGANNQDDQYSFGIWSSGTFGTCTEWFGTLVPIGIPTVENAETYQWTGPGIESIDQTITITQAGTYNVMFTDCNGCMISDEITITECSQSTAGLGDYVWIDVDRNGIQDPGELPLAGVVVNLYLSTDIEKTDPIATATTDENGYYEFTELNPSFDYVVQFDASNIETGLYFITTQGDGASAGIENDSDANPDNGYTDIIDLDPEEFDATIDAGFYCSSCFLNLDVRLQATSNGDGALMIDNLRADDLLPLENPYGADPYYAYEGTEATTQGVLGITGENAIIDWVLVDLRDDTLEIPIAARAALLQRDGNIVDVDGVSPLIMPVKDGDYYVSVRHRNHLGVMTKNPVTIGINGADVDFTDPATPIHGRHACANVNGFSELWAGNAGNDGKIIFQGADNDANEVFFDIMTYSENVAGQVNYIKRGYSNTDLDLNCNTIYQGLDNDLNNVFFNVLFHPDNTMMSPNYIITEQIPE